MFINSIEKMYKITDCFCTLRMQQLKQKAEALSAMLVFESPDYVTDDESSNGGQSITKMDPYIKYKIIISYPKVLKLICQLFIKLSIIIKYLFQVPVKFDVIEKMTINEEEHSVNKIQLITDENVS